MARGEIGRHPSGGGGYRQTAATIATPIAATVTAMPPFTFSRSPRGTRVEAGNLVAHALVSAGIDARKNKWTFRVDRTASGSTVSAIPRRRAVRPSSAFQRAMTVA